MTSIMVEEMTRWWIVFALVACEGGKKSVATQGSGSPVAPVAPADAQVADSPMPDSAPDAPAGPAPVDTDKLMEVEAIGPLRWGMSEAEAMKHLAGAPTSKTKPVEEGATGEYYSNWTWKAAGISLDMTSEKRSSPAKIRLIHASAPCTYATARGIKIGDSLAKVAAAYPKSDEGSDDPTQFLVGSPYGGLLFVLKDEKTVSEIILGPMAF